MPIKPLPFRQHCTACNWRGHVIALRSDALSPADIASILETCPLCGAADLQSEPQHGIASILQRALGDLLGGGLSKQPEPLHYDLQLQRTISGRFD